MENTHRQIPWRQYLGLCSWRVQVASLIKELRARKPLSQKTKTKPKNAHNTDKRLIPVECNISDFTCLITDKSFNSIQFSSVLSTLQPHELQHTRPPCLSPTPGVYSNSCPSSRWCHPAISSSVVPFSSCPQSLPASGSFPMSQFFAWGGQSIGVSASALVVPMNTQDWSPSGWTGWISLQSKGLSRVFSNSTAQKHQFFGTQLSSQSNSHIHTWPLEKP